MACFEELRGQPWKWSDHSVPLGSKHGLIKILGKTIERLESLSFVMNTKDRALQIEGKSFPGKFRLNERAISLAVD